MPTVNSRSRTYSTTSTGTNRGFATRNQVVVRTSQEIDASRIAAGRNPLSDSELSRLANGGVVALSEADMIRLAQNGETSPLPQQPNQQLVAAENQIPASNNLKTYGLAALVFGAIVFVGKKMKAKNKSNKPKVVNV